MEIVLIIVSGVVIISVLGIVSDVVNKAIEAKKHQSPLQDQAILALTQRVAALEEERERNTTTVKKLEDDLGFMQRLLEKK